MSEKRYGLTEDGELIDNELGSVYMVKGRSALYLCKELNHLHEENQSIQEKVFKLMDWLEKEKGVNREEIKEYWNELWKKELLE